MKAMRISILSLLFIISLVGSVGFGRPGGDLNNDNRVDCLDLQLLVAQWLDEPGDSANINGDGRVDMKDFALLAEDWHEPAASVVINEIHYDPDVKTELVEYIELYNAGTTDVNLTGWYFSSGLTYSFPAGSILPAWGY